MLFDKTAVINLIQNSMSPADARNVPKIELAMAACLDELSMRLRSESYLKNYETTVASGAREKTLSGDTDHEDLRYIFALKMGSGSTQRVLEYRKPQVFLRDYDDPEEDADIPEYYTIMEASEGFPIARFNCPLSSSQTLTVYYYVDFTPDNVAIARSVSAVVEGTMAWFYGIHTPEGQTHEAKFRELVKVARASDKFMSNQPQSMRLSKEDRVIRSTFRDMQLRRR